MTKQPSRGEVQSDSRGSDGVGTTGRDLRARRESLGEELADVAETLRIRLDFLKALEEGNYDALPGSAYAVGFVRSYARYLGMDSTEVARQFKIEVSGETPTAKLDFLTPVQESRIPRGAIVLVTMLLAITIYGVWYYMNARELTFADIIPEVPSQFFRTAGTSVPAQDSSAEHPSVAPVEKGAAALPETVPVGDGTAPDPDASSTPSPSKATAKSPAPPSNTAIGVESSGVTPPAEPLPPPAEPVPSAPPAQAVNPEPAVAPAAETPPAATADVATPGSAVPEEPVAAAAPVSAEAAPVRPPPRIEIRAIADSWVQVRTAGGNLLMTRIVAQGTSFVVPAEEGLKLTTGNAGGLEILVDGVVVPTLGPFGAVRRDVALDPERLKAGTAVAR